MLQRYCGLIDETQRFLGAVLCEDAKARNLEYGDKSRAVRGSRHRFCAQPCRRTLAQKAASRGIPLAAALQIFRGLAEHRDRYRNRCHIRISCTCT